MKYVVNSLPYLLADLPYLRNLDRPRTHTNTHTQISNSQIDQLTDW